MKAQAPRARSEIPPELTENYWENLSTGGRSEARQTAANHRRNLDLMVNRGVGEEGCVGRCTRRAGGAQRLAEQKPSSGSLACVATINAIAARCIHTPLRFMQNSRAATPARGFIDEFARAFPPRAQTLPQSVFASSFLLYLRVRSLFAFQKEYICTRICTRFSSFFFKFEIHIMLTIRLLADVYTFV